MSSSNFGPGLPPLAPPPVKQKSWFARHKVITGFLGLVVLGTAIGAASGGSSSDKDSVAQSGGSASSSSPVKSDSAASNSKSADTKAGETKTADTKAEDTKSTGTKPADTQPVKPEVVEGLQPDGKSWVYGDWKISNLKISQEDYIHDFKIVADVKYLGTDTSGGDKCFDLTLDKGDRQVASGTGCADSVQPGKTAKLDFFTADDYVSGPWDITLNKTW